MFLIFTTTETNLGHVLWHSALVIQTLYFYSRKPKQANFMIVCRRQMMSIVAEFGFQMTN
jgi:hypothetical protein